MYSLTARDNSFDIEVWMLWRADAIVCRIAVASSEPGASSHPYT